MKILSTLLLLCVFEITLLSPPGVNFFFKQEIIHFSTKQIFEVENFKYIIVSLCFRYRVVEPAYREKVNLAFFFIPTKSLHALSLFILLFFFSSKTF